MLARWYGGNPGIYGALGNDQTDSEDELALIPLLDYERAKTFFVGNTSDLDLYSQTDGLDLQSVRSTKQKEEEAICPCSDSTSAVTRIRWLPAKDYDYDSDEDRTW